MCKELAGVAGLAAATVEYGGVFGYFFAVFFGDDAAYVFVDFLGLLGCGGLASADGPDGFVGHDNFAKVFGGEVEQSVFELGFDYIEVLAGFALFEYFADAEYGRQAVGESQGHFFAEGFGCFTIVLTSFAVAEDDIGGAGGGYHFGGNFACICSFDVVGAVLCTQSEFAFICDYGVH